MLSNLRLALLGAAALLCCVFGAAEYSKATAPEAEATVLHDLDPPYGGGGEPQCQIFPPDDPWNTDISQYPVHPLSNTYVDGIGRNTHLHPDFGTIWDGAPIGIPYVIVDGAQPKVPMTFFYDDESDHANYPIPPDAAIEGGPNSGGDRHVLVIDDTNCLLYETGNAYPVNGGQSWDVGAGAIFDLNSNALRPDTWTSADAAGLPIFPGLARYEEVVQQGVIDHALRFTINDTRRAYIHPATHYASSNEDPNVPPMGLRVRMKASYDCSWASQEVQVVCTALKKYGMYVADNGADWYISGAPDPRWDDDRLGDLKDITGNAFEAVYTGPAITEQGPEGTPWPTPQPGETPNPTVTHLPTGTPHGEPTPTPTGTPGPHESQPPHETGQPEPTGHEPTPTPTATPHPGETGEPHETPGVTEPGQHTATPTPRADGTPDPQPHKHGDIDCNGGVDPVDALMTLRHTAGLGVEKKPGCPDPGDDTGGKPWADADCDGDVDSEDALILLRFVAALPFDLPNGCPGFA